MVFFFLSSFLPQIIKIYAFFSEAAAAPLLSFPQKNQQNQYKNKTTDKLKLLLCMNQSMMCARFLFIYEGSIGFFFFHYHWVPAMNGSIL